MISVNGEDLYRVYTSPTAWNSPMARNTRLTSVAFTLSSSSRNTQSWHRLAGPKLADTHNAPRARRWCKQLYYARFQIFFFPLWANNALTVPSNLSLTPSLDQHSTNKSSSSVPQLFPLSCLSTLFTFCFAFGMIFVSVCNSQIKLKKWKHKTRNTYKYLSTLIH